MRPGAALVDRAAGFFVAPRPEVADDRALAEPAVVPRRTATRPATRMPLRAAVLGRPGTVQPVAAALANALRAAAGAPAAALALWEPAEPASAPAAALHLAPALSPGSPPAGPGSPHHPDPPSLPATPAASRLAARLTARGLPAHARGRLACLPLADHPVAAVLATRRASGALEVPLVAGLAGPRCEVLEGLLAEQDLIVVVTADPEGALARVALERCEVTAVACPPCRSAATRAIARAGLIGPRSLSEAVRAAVRAVAARAGGTGPGADTVGETW